MIIRLARRFIVDGYQQPGLSTSAILVFAQPSMTTEQLAQSAITEETPPANISPELHSLWLAKSGRWEEAHNLCSSIPDPDGAWIHAYLHREEGDLPNARYWYHRAGRTEPASTVILEEEWRTITSHFLSRG
jgi:hypothetical protein